MAAEQFVDVACRSCGWTTQTPPGVHSMLAFRKHTLEAHPLPELSLPAPECRLGYTQAQVDSIVGNSRRAAFDHWMRGQTVALCQTTDGPSACRGGHGVVVYSHDVQRFLRGGEVID